MSLPHLLEHRLDGLGEGLSEALLGGGHNVSVNGDLVPLKARSDAVNLRLLGVATQQFLLGIIFANIGGLVGEAVLGHGSQAHIDAIVQLGKLVASVLFLRQNIQKRRLNMVNMAKNAKMRRKKCGKNAKKKKDVK